MMSGATITASFPKPPTTVGMRRSPGVIKSNPHQQFFTLSTGRKGVFQTLDAMASCVRGEVAPDHAGYQSPVIAAKASEIESLMFGQFYPESVFNFTQTCIRYLDHPFDLQIVQDALVTLGQGTGDCVSMSVLVATLLASRDYPVWFVCQDVTGEEYSHVYCETVVRGKVTALDPVGSEPMGWRQPLQPGGFETTWPIFLEVQKLWQAR